MADRFYVNCPLAQGPVVLTGPEAHHLATVMRIRVGETVCLFNGDGAEYPANVVEVHKRQVILDVTGRDNPNRELPFGLELAAPLPKSDRADVLIEKLTELGVTRFVPLETERTVVHPRESRIEKLQRVVIESSKQCRRNVLMEIGALTPWAQYCRGLDLPAHRFVAHPGGEARVQRSNGDVAIAVGPEGGFSDAEIECARSAGWQIVEFGPRVLRIETAAIALAVLCGAAT